MSDHLPECDSAFTDLHTANCVCRCICPELRACEQRMLDAAREAVATLRGCLGTDDNGDGTVWVEKVDALAAIDALKEKP